MAAHGSRGRAPFAGAATEGKASGGRGRGDGHSHGTIRQNGKVESCGAVQLLLNTLKAKKKGRELGRTLWLTAFSKNRGAANYSG